jgi:MoxR-like ATPase
MNDLLNKIRTSAMILLEDGRHWLTASPTPINRLDSSNVERFFETGPELIQTIVGAIERGQHVALAGPRGCGKSYCAAKAAELAVKAGFVPSNGIIKIQGNKELPRDYLIEDDIALKVSNGVVLPKRKDAPLFQQADRDADGLPATWGPDEKLVKIKGEGPDGLMLPHQRLVLFLDEVNRFSDGVLDSLLLLLEEGQAIMGGTPYKLRIVVLMTMNPPGYDSSARNLSPPLSARIGRQYRLLSPQLDVLTDVIAPEAIARAAPTEQAALPESEASDEVEEPDETEAPPKDPTPSLGPVDNPTIVPPDSRTLRRAAAATLCCWGNPSSAKPSFEYLSEDMQHLLSDLASSDTALAAGMSTLSELCHYGPDARALLDWIKAASIVARNEAIALWQPTIEVRGRHFVESAITVISHKIQDSFSSASQPGNTRRKEEAIHVIVRTLMTGSPRIDALLARRVDDDKLLGPASEVIWGRSAPARLRDEMIRLKVVEDDAVQAWCAFLTNLADGKAKSALEADLETKWILEPLTATTKAFSAKFHKAFATWLAGEPMAGLPSTLRRSVRSELARIAKGRSYEKTLANYFDRLRCVQDRVWPNGEALMKLISEGSTLARSRQTFQTVGECIDLFWVKAEHYGPDVVQQIDLRLEPLGLHHTTRESVNKLLRNAAGVIAKNKARGRRTRAAMRAL